MSPTARRLLRYSKCPGSARMAGEETVTLFMWAPLWLEWLAGQDLEKWRLVKEFHHAVKQATPLTGIERELWLTGTVAGVHALKFASNEDLEASTKAGNWCEWCPAREGCPTRAKQGAALAKCRD